MNETTYDKKEAQTSVKPSDRPNIVKVIEMTESATQPTPRVCVNAECTLSGVTFCHYYYIFLI